MPQSASAKKIGLLRVQNKKKKPKMTERVIYFKKKGGGAEYKDEEEKAEGEPLVGWVTEGPLFILKTGLRLNHGQLASCPHGRERQENGQSASRKAIDKAIPLEGFCV